MTKTTLKALWVGGGGVLATWLAVAPDSGAPPATATTSRPSAVSEQTADMLNAQAERLRARTQAVELNASTRNPFRFSDANRSTSSVRQAPQVRAEAPIAPIPMPPLMTLSGIAEKDMPEGVQRTAVISADGQLYLVKEGEAVAGLYTVVKIDSDAVVLRDGAGADRRFVLP